MPSPGRTLYDILGLTPDASATAIASAYQAKQVEIDTHEATVAISEAYQVLSNPERRKKYDAKLVAAALAASIPVVLEPAPTPGKWKLSAVIGVSVLALTVGIVGWKLRPEPPDEVTVAATVAPRPQVTEQAPAEEASAAPEAAEVTPKENPPAPPAITPPVLVGKEIPPHELHSRFSQAMLPVTTVDAKGRFLSQGTAIFMDQDTVITNCHILKGARRITVTEGTEIEATVLVADEELDLCKLRVPNMARGGWGRQITMAPLSDLRIGQRVYAIASSWYERALSEGIVNSMRDEGQRVLIQISNPVNPTWDGGGLFTADGRLVGLLTTRHSFGSGFNAAIPVDSIKNMQARSAASALPTDAPREVVASLIGRWRCKEPWEKRNGTYDYGADGVLGVAYDSGGKLTAPYRLEGMTVHLRTSKGEEYRLQIESISSGRMVQFFDAGRRMNCQREA